MKRIKLISCIISLIVFVAMLSLPVSAQEIGLETTPISGSLDYIPRVLLLQSVGNTTFYDVAEEEVWSGDIVGTATAQDRIMISSSRVWEAWIIFEIEATVLGEYEGTLTIMSLWKREADIANWHGKWTILSGTGDLENIHGFGVGWGPGFNRDDPEASPDIFYSGEVVFLEPESE